MTPRSSDHLSIFGLVFFVLESIARLWSRGKFAILTLKPILILILIYRTWAIRVRFSNSYRVLFGQPVVSTFPSPPLSRGY